MRAKISVRAAPKKKITRFFDVHITNHCQLSCRHCYLPQKNTEHMDLNVFQALCQDFTSLSHPIKKVDIILSGGEPLIHSEFSMFVEYLRSIDQPIRLSSNGLLIPKFIHLFNKKDGIQISIDGDEKVHDFIRGNGVYLRAVSALHALNDAHINHSVTMALCQENIGCIDSVVDLCKDTGTHTLNITLFQQHRHTTLTPIGFDEWVEKCDQVRSQIVKDHIPIRIPSTCIQNGCIAGILGLSVLPDGTYWDCSRNQEVIGKYPEPISKCLYQEHINNTSVRNQFETCCKGVNK